MAKPEDVNIGAPNYATDIPILIDGPKDADSRKHSLEEEGRKRDEKLALDLQSRQTRAQELQAKTNVAIGLLTVALIIVSVSGTWVSYLQFRTARDSSDAALAASIAAIQQVRVSQDANRLTESNALSSDKQFKQSLQETKQSNAFNHEALVSVQRAFVVFGRTMLAWPTYTAAGGGILKWRFAPTVENTGTTPTRELVTHSNWQVIPSEIPDYFAFADLGEREKISFVLGPHASGTSAGIDIDPPLLSAVEDHRLHLYFWGWVTYKDIFNGTRPHVSMYCMEATEIRGNPLKDPQLLLVYTMCKHHNCADDDCSGEKGNPLKGGNLPRLQ